MDFEALPEQVEIRGSVRALCEQFPGGLDLAAAAYVGRHVLDLQRSY